VEKPRVIPVPTGGPGPSDALFLVGRPPQTQIGSDTDRNYLATGNPRIDCLERAVQSRTNKTATRCRNFGRAVGGRRNWGISFGLEAQLQPAPTGLRRRVHLESLSSFNPENLSQRHRSGEK